MSSDIVQSGLSDAASTGNASRPTAIVTGSGRGIGRATALALARSGYAVGLIARTEGDLVQTRRLIMKEGGVAVLATADVRDEFALDAAFSAIESEVGVAELLVTMAGTAASIGPSWKVRTGDWWADVETNLRGTFLAARRALPSMISSGDGRIVAVSSYGINRPMPYLSAYAAAKSGVAAFAEALNAEVMAHGVKVFTITPGTVRTRLLENLSDSDEGRRWFPQLAARRDTVPPERAAELVVRLASGEADILSGRFLHVADNMDSLLSRGTAISVEDTLVMRLRRSTVL